MQVESATKWRVPPLDLSAVSVLTNEAERRWAHGAAVAAVANLSTRSVTTASDGDQRTANNATSNTTTANSSTTLTAKKIVYGADGLPIDPRDWTRANVWTWLINLAQSEGLDISPELAQKFPMNGKALCLMSLDMYLSRVPVGGKMLYRDFRVRLARAMSL
ncbi:ETS homologous factor [Anopheles aquasalis]|uniref:ETS homologous factor n=1 Tax=Anopheles aquasalis TaxID=42839 RepID=UPI00215AFAB0|nr:ETS homologous factor [Anopheles aquasalis]XP_050092266.1 ETS homologous factor [Anopheles aquasalis]